MTGFAKVCGFLSGLLLPISFVCRTPPAMAASAEVVPLSVEELLKAPTLAAYASPQFSPDGKFLAYVVTENGRRPNTVDRLESVSKGLLWYAIAGDVWIADLTTGERRNLTGGAGHNWSPAWSPDGRRLAFLADRSAGSELGPARLWIWELGSGKLRQVGDADVREGFAGLDWSADGRSVFVTFIPEDLGREGFAAKIIGKKSPAEARSASGTTAKVFEFDPGSSAAAPMTDQLNLDLWRRDLGLVDAETGAIQRLVAGSRVGHYVLSADRRRLAYSVWKSSEKPGTGQYFFDLVVQDIAGGTPRVVASNQRLEIYKKALALSPSGDRLAWRTGGPLSEDEVYVVSVAAGSPKRLSLNARTAKSLNEGEPPAWGPSGREVFFTRDGVLWRAAADGSTPAAAFASLPGSDLEIIAPRQQRLFSPDGGASAVLMSLNLQTKQAGLVRVDLKSGAVDSIFAEDERYGGYANEPTITPDGTGVAYVAEDSRHPPDIFIRAGNFTRPRRVSEVAPALGNRAFGRAEVIEWRSLDGATMRGALVYPAGYEAGKRYPLIVKVYGGSAISDDLNYFGYGIAAVENLQIYATRGYALLLADSSLGLGTPMVDLMKSVLPGVDKAIETGVADPDRIGITGHSYGGYSTLCLITQSPRFRAAVMRAGQGDMIGSYSQLSPDGTNYGLAWAEKGQGRMGGSPWEFRNRYLENSPFFQLDRVRTPLLIIHGSEDDAVHVSLADQIFTGLRRLGATVTYARYEGEDHWEGLWAYANQLDSLNRSIAWFDRYLKASPAAAAVRGKAVEKSRS